jgi:hypothetical protein
LISLFGLVLAKERDLLEGAFGKKETAEILAGE